MKYLSTLPLSALIAVSVLTILMYVGLLPPGIEMLAAMQTGFGDYFHWLIVLIILLESIVYVGFYFPGQFFAVMLVVMAKPDWQDIGLLTLSMVVAATLGSSINYGLGRKVASSKAKPVQPQLMVKSLLIAMIHINSLAFFMFAQGANRGTFKIVLLAGVLNLPYYLALILATSLLSEQVIQMAENTWLILVAISLWLAIAVYIDCKRHRYNYNKLTPG